MKIYNWIDSFFDTKEKRRTICIWICLLYCLWQCVWMDVFFFKLAQVQDYNSLFTFMNGMGVYSNSVLIRIAFSLISSNEISLLSVGSALLKDVYLFDWICLCVVFVLILSKKKSYLFVIFFLLYFIFLCLILMLGLKVGALSSLISLLKILAYASLVVFVLSSIYILYRIVKGIFRFSIL